MKKVKCRKPPRQREKHSMMAWTEEGGVELVEIPEEGTADDRKEKKKRRQGHRSLTSKNDGSLLTMNPTGLGSLIIGAVLGRLAMSRGPLDSKGIKPL